MTKGPIALALELAELLDALDIPWVVGGSVASSLVGEPRATMDLDVAVELTTEDVASSWPASRGRPYTGGQSNRSVRSCADRSSNAVRSAGTKAFAPRRRQWTLRCPGSTISSSSTPRAK